MVPKQFRRISPADSHIATVGLFQTCKRTRNTGAMKFDTKKQAVRQGTRHL